MSRRLPRRIALALGALAVLAWSTSVVAARRSTAERTATAELHAWSALRADASALLGRRVRLVAQFEGRVERWNAYVSRFGPDTHTALQFWADEQHLWRVDEYEWPQVRVFVPKGSAVDEILGRAAKYERYELEGTLRELFLAEPWIEVEAARRLPEQVGEGTVIHAGRALQLMDSGVWRLADAELEQALQATLPAHARAELERLRGSCHAQTGDESDPLPPRRWAGGSAPVHIRRPSAAPVVDDG